MVWYFFLHLSPYQLQSSKESNFVNTNIVFELHNTNSFQKIVEIPQYHHCTETLKKKGIIFTENFQGNKGWWLAWTPLSNHRSWRWRRGKTWWWCQLIFFFEPFNLSSSSCIRTSTTLTMACTWKIRKPKTAASRRAGMVRIVVDAIPKTHSHYIQIGGVPKRNYFFFLREKDVLK